MAGTEHVLARTADRVRAADRVTTADGVTVDPWPFADGGGPVTVPARRLPATRYDTDEALRAALARAEPVTLRRALHSP